ncbi:14513_t:CDS:1, partial [Funneliformis caledonium]
KHDQDISNSLHLFSTWITKIANSDNISLKSKALSLIVPTLQILEEKHEITNTIITP